MSNQISRLTVPALEYVGMSLPIRNFSALKDITPGNLQVFANNDCSEPLSPGTLLSSLNMTGKSPLVIRYPLSNDNIVAHISFSRSSIGTIVGHTTGAWFVLRAETKENFDRLRNGDFCFVAAQNNKTISIDDVFTSNSLVDNIKSTNQNCSINFSVQLKGKKPTVTENLPDGVPLTPELQSCFVNTIDLTSCSFKYKFSNGAMARCYINPFMHTTVCHVVSSHPSLVLSVEQDFDGSRGYGNLDYVVFCYELAIPVTVAELEKMPQGLTQNIVQLHTVAEQLLGKRKREEPSYDFDECNTIYGIVTTGRVQFIRWTGTPDKPRSQAEMMKSKVEKTKDDSRDEVLEEFVLSK
ncbi:7490_t:CDS:2, partial [Paraglomus occultum]